MSIAIDTNIFLYAHFDLFEQHKPVKFFLKKFLTSKTPFYLSWQVFYEYIRITTHPRILQKPLSLSQATADLIPYLKNSMSHLLTETENHLTFFEELIKLVPSAKGNFIHDCHYAALLKEHGISSMITCDMDFRKFGFLEVINPLQA